jgi:lipid A 3-O-deacylase
MIRIGALAGAAATAAALVGTPAAAANVSFGAGHDDASAAILSLQLDSNPVWSLGPVGFGVGAGIDADTDGDIWIGGGFTGVWPFAEHWAAQGSLMAGVYAVGDGGYDLGSDLEFRTRLGVSRSIAFPWRLGVALEHKSNGGLGDYNPGLESILLLLSRPIGGWGYR